MLVGGQHLGPFGPIAEWLFVGLFPLWGLFVGYAAGRETGGGLISGLGVGIVAVAMMHLLHMDRGRPFGEATAPPIVWALSLAAVLACGVGGLLGTRAKLRRRSLGSEKEGAANARQ